eukprot:3353262-Lingulodinium_polyedra.AAC.1
MTRPGRTPTARTSLGITTPHDGYGGPRICGGRPLAARPAAALPLMLGPCLCRLFAACLVLPPRASALCASARPLRS